MRLRVFLAAVMLTGLAFTATASADGPVSETWTYNSCQVAQIATAQNVVTSGSNPPRGALRLNDCVAGRKVQLGFYEWGAGIFTPSLFEFFTNGVSIRNQNDTSQPFLAVRDIGDTSDLRLLHDGTQGIITTTGANRGDIVIRLPQNSVSFEVQNYLGTTVASIDATGGLHLGGGLLYVDPSGRLIYRQPDGTERVL